MTDTTLTTEAFADEGERFALAMPAALAAATVGAVLWALFTYWTGTALGLVAIAIGALVGLTVRAVGRGRSQRFGVLGGAAAALGWALGTVLCDIAFAANAAGLPFATVLTRLGVGDIARLATGAADAMDLLLLAIAVWEGYKLSFRRD